MRHWGDTNRHTSLATVPKYLCRQPHWLDEPNYRPGPPVALSFRLSGPTQISTGGADRDHQSSVNSRFSYLWVFLIDMDALRSRTSLRNFIDEAKRSCDSGCSKTSH